jgi:hypothetical protein
MMMPGRKYNSQTHMLYYKGDYKTDNPISSSARSKMIEALTATYSKKKSLRKFGEIYFGHDGMKTRSGQDVEHGKSDATIRLLGFLGLGYRGAAYLNLDLFDDNDLRDVSLDYSGLTDKGYSVRAYNLARVVEHEWFGHILSRASDPASDYGMATKPGKAEFWPNLFRTEIGVPVRSNYSLYTGRGIVILFGINSSQLQQVANDPKKTPNFPYILSPIVKNP